LALKPGFRAKNQPDSQLKGSEIFSAFELRNTQLKHLSIQAT